MKPTLSFPPALLLRAQGSRLGMKALLLDVDGVLTDGRLYIGEHGEQVKAFSTLDGHGLKMLQHAGIAVALITGRDSLALRRRVHDLGIAHACYGISDKAAAASALLAQQHWDWADVAAMGDDWPDLPGLTRAGLACAPPTAHAEVRAVAHHITHAAAGYGAVREVCDLLLMASGHYARLLHEQRQSLDVR